MKILILFCFTLLHLIGLTQTNCPYYDKYIHIGDSILEKKGKADFKAAIYSYSTAMLHCPDSAQKARNKILEVFREIEELRKEAEAAKELALIEKNKAVKAKKETDKALNKAEKLLGTFYFYNDRFALAYKDMGLSRAAVTMFGFYFIDKNGDRVNKLGEWTEAGPFKESGFAKVKEGSHDYIVDTFGRKYSSAYDIKNIDSSILALDLSDERWDSIPDEVLEHKPLQVLILNGRQYFVNQMSTLPEKIDRLKNLENLQLSFCLIHSLTPQIGELKNLAILDLSDNRLSFLPPQIGELKNLKSLDLSFNQLSFLPIQIGELKNLTDLNLYANPIPQSELEKIRKLLPDCKVFF